MKIITNVSEAVEVLLSQQILVLFKGKSEWGPRALGNRSILFDARNPQANKIVNRVKKREEWRPFACSVLEDHVDEWFDLKSLKSSPYMSFAVDAKDKAKKFTPSIVHENGTCRIQTVNKNSDSVYYDLIYTFYLVTNVPLVLNTSFNLAGEPLVETLEDAKDSFSRSELQYLYLP